MKINVGKKREEVLKAERDRFLDNYYLLSHWLEIKNLGRSVSSYFTDMGYQKIAVYGMGELANRLAEDLEGSGIRIAYGIDRDAGCSVSRIENVYAPQDELPEADVIVVTPYYAFDSIKRDIQEKTACTVVSLEEVIWSV